MSPTWPKSDPPCLVSSSQLISQIAPELRARNQQGRHLRHGSPLGPPGRPGRTWPTRLGLGGILTPSNMWHDRMGQSSHFGMGNWRKWAWTTQALVVLGVFITQIDIFCDFLGLFKSWCPTHIVADRLRTAMAQQLYNGNSPAVLRCSDSLHWGPFILKK